MQDLLEIVTDWSPIGPDGTDSGTHLTDAGLARRRAEAEESAFELYVAMLPADAAVAQREVLREYMAAASPEARFVKAVDKIQTLAFVLLKKSGHMEDAHVLFTVRHAERGLAYFPELEAYVREMRARLLTSVADARGVDVADLEARVLR
jgi:5'-deoxynucleotidase YfbR-like HD superfamily hydrolase